MITLDLELKAHQKPYDGLAELIGELGNPFAAHEMGLSATPRIEIAIAPPARISRGAIKDSELLIDVLASSGVDRGKLTLGFRAFQARGNQVQHMNFTGDIEWKSTDPLLTATFRQGLPDIGLAQAFLSYDGEFLGSWWARDQSVSFSARSALHKAIDSENAFVAKFFDDRNSFEERVLLLLSLLNLDCLYYGNIAELKDGPDILAASDQGHLYVIECTTGDINSRGKLRRLYERTNSIRAALANSAYRPREVLPVMVTTSSHAETSHCMDAVSGLSDRLSLP